MFLLVWMPLRRQAGDVAGAALIGIGASLYLTEFWRDPEGRGQLFHGALDVPQIAAIVLVLLGAWMLPRKEKRATPRRLFLKRLPMDEARSISVPPEAAGQRLDQFLARSSMA